MRTMLLAGMIVLISPSSNAQSERSLVNRGNDLYEEEEFDAAEIQYRKALKENEASLPGRFNLGNSLHRQGKFDQSATEFEKAATSTADIETRSGAMYNRGNSYLEAKQYDAAIASYREALKLDPHDRDSKYNLSYALMKRQEEQQDQQGGEQNQQDKEDQEKNDQQDNQQNQDGDQKQDQKDNRKNKPGENQNDGEPQQGNEGQSQRPQMSRADAERILQVLKDSEKEVQKKLRAKPQQGSKSEKDW